MTTTLMILLALLAGFLCTSREAGDNARTPAEMAAMVRGTGWRAVWQAPAGLAAVCGLVAVAAAGLALSAAAKLAYALAMVLAALAWHIRTLLSGHPGSPSTSALGGAA